MQSLRAPSPAKEPVGNTAEPLGPDEDSGGGASTPSTPGPLTLTSQKNYNITGTNYGRHETAIAPSERWDVQNGFVPNWIMASNGCFDTTGDSGAGTHAHGCGGIANPKLNMAWAWSDGLAATVWHFNKMTSACQFCDPCDSTCSTCGVNRCMTGGTAFGGLGGDPSLAPLTNSAFNGSDAGITGQRVLLTNVALDATQIASDVIVLMSPDGGQGWTWPHLVTDSTTPFVGSGPDNPVIASHFAAPWNTFVAWTVDGGQTGYLRQISYDASSPPNFTLGTALTIPSGSNLILHPSIAIGNVPNCTSGGSDEAVFVAWATAGDYCDGVSTSTFYNSWWFDVYDTVSAAWAANGPFMIDSDNKWPPCVGTPLSTGGGDNNSKPVVAAEPANYIFWFAYDKSKYLNNQNLGTRISTIEWNFSCNGGTLQGPTKLGTWQSPDTCYLPNNNCPGLDGGSGCNAGGGNCLPNDAWGPAINFVRNTSGNRELVVTWYDTGGNGVPGAGDPNNTLANIQGAYAQASTVSLPTTSLLVSSDGGTGWVGWDHTLGTWWDYQAVQPNYSTYTFLAAWGGDARLGTGKPGIYAAIIK